MGAYAELHARSLKDPEGFWSEVAEQISWSKPFTTVCDQSQSPATDWFADGELNTCYNALDRHVEAGRGDQAALIYDSPVTNQKITYTYSQMLDRVAKIAGMIREQGVGKGDRVIIYMPMIPEAAMAMLACARLGVVHSVVFGGFAAAELATRIDDASVKLIIAASCGVEPSRVVEYKPLIEAAIDIASHKPDGVIMLQRPQCEAVMKLKADGGRDIDWVSAEAAASPADCVNVGALDPLYVLYTSGTTGAPKGIVRQNGGHAVALQWSMKNLYDINPGEVFWAASDVGWVVGHSYIVYAPLIAGCTTLMFEGKPVGTPDPGAFWRVISEHKVKALFTAPTALRAIKQQDPDGKLVNDYDMSQMRTLFLAGERC
ncbi:MAG: AMP-binding protein, partial [Alphaproteobacteria bacterium]